MATGIGHDSKFIKGGFGLMLEEHMTAIVKNKVTKKTDSQKSFSVNSQDEIQYDGTLDAYMFLETSVKRLSVKLFYEFCKNDELHYKIKVQKIKIRLLKNSCQGMKTKIDRERAKFG